MISNLLNHRPEVLVVDDNPDDVALVRHILQDADLDVTVIVAGDGEQALSHLQEGDCAPDLVLTDLKMPRMDGIALVERIRLEFSALPVILMTAFGSEEVALRALQKGAASYVPKDHLQTNLVATMEQILDVVQAEQEILRLQDCLVESEHCFILENDFSLIPPVVQRIGDEYCQMMQCDENERMRLTIALSEALTNAIFHGNLQLSSHEKEKGDDWLARAEERRATEPYSRRRVHLTARLSRTGSVFTVRDEGPGFKPSILPDPRDSANVGKIWGRGLFLIRIFMDEVFHNDRGNEITMIKNTVQ